MASLPQDVRLSDPEYKLMGDRLRRAYGLGGDWKWENNLDRVEEFMTKWEQGDQAYRNAILFREDRQISYDFTQAKIKRDDKWREIQLENWEKQYNWNKEQGEKHRLFLQAQVDREQERFRLDLAERGREREERKAQFDKQFAAQQAHNADLLQFHKDQAADNKKSRQRAEIQAETAARTQVLSAKGYAANKVTTTTNALQPLILRQAARQRRTRLNFAPA